MAVARDLLALTKPRVISLLLVTAVAPMYITGLGAPPLSLVGWVLLGGFLMAGGANAINMWFDQDIDHFMSRTKLRPVPSGRIPPRAALAFGIGLGSLAFAILWRFANPLSAWLALGGLLFYVLVYTVWLKRSTPQNIVIGGAAGAFPPAGGLRRHGGAPGPRRLLPVRHHLLLDPAPFLGAGAAQEGGVRQGGGADAPGGARRARDQGADAHLHPDPDPADHPPRPLRRLRTASTRSRRWPSAGGSSGTTSSSFGRRGSPPPPGRCTSTRWPTWRCSSWP